MSVCDSVSLGVSGSVCLCVTLCHAVESLTNVSHRADQRAESKAEVKTYSCGML